LRRYLEVTQTLAYARPDRGKKLTSVFVNARLAEALVGMPIILGEIEVVLDELSADKGVEANTVAANPRIEEREGKKKNQAQEKLRLPGAMCGRCAEVLQAHRQSQLAALLRQKGPV
jgi:hypothetical protein